MNLLFLQIFVPILAALTGAAMAGLASYIAGKGMRQHEWMLSLARERLTERQRLYARFLGEADRHQLEVIARGNRSLDNVMPLLTMYNEILLLASAEVEQAAKQICDIAVTELSEAAASRNAGHFTAKTLFLKAARKELDLLEARAGRGKA